MIPFWALLIPYGIFLALFVILALVDVLHMVHFGTAGFMNFLALLIFFAGTAAILWATAGLLEGFDWFAPMANGFSPDLRLEL